jgi:hypothetical protein
MVTMNVCETANANNTKKVNKMSSFKRLGELQSDFFHTILKVMEF